MKRICFIVDSIFSVGGVQRVTTVIAKELAKDYDVAIVTFDKNELFNQNLYAEAKERYHKARLEYAAYADANQDMVWATDRIKLMDLENEMQLQYESYRTITQQLRAAEAKVQEDTPSFTTLQSATVPVKKSGPKRTKIVLVIVFLAFLGTSAWILHKEGQLKPLLGLS